VSDLPTGWAIASLAEIATLITDGDHNPPKRVPDGVPHLTARNVKGGRLVLDRCTFISPEDFTRTSRRYTPHPGDVIVTCVGTLGQTAIVPNGLSFSADRNLAAIRPSKAILSPFLKAALDAPGPQAIMQNGSGSTAQPHLYLSDLRNLKVRVPPLAEQRRIIAVIDEQFSRLDAGVAALQRAQRSLKRLRTAILQSLVVGDLILDSRNEFFRNAELPQLPDNWSWTNLGDHIAEGPQNGLYLPASRYGSGVPILRINDFQSDWVRPKENLKVVSSDSEQTKMFALAAGDLVINRVNSMTHLGKCMVVGEDLAGALFESNMMRLRLTNDIEGSYLALYLGSPLGRSFLLKNAKWAVNQASINQPDVRATPIAVPPHEEQKRIVSVYEIVSRSLLMIVGDIQINLRRSDSLRSSVLTAAFSGKLVVQDPTEESASALLDRIAAGHASPHSRKSTGPRKPETPREGVTTV
jgi:type I restriction enzyme, S subunit